MSIEVRGMIPLLFVFDMPTSIKFYRDVLGFTVEKASGAGPAFDWAFLTLNGVEVMLNTMYESDRRPAAPDPRRTAAHSDTTLYFSCPDVDAAYAHLRVLGTEVRPPEVAPYGMKQVYISDPDGFSLCFQWPATQHADH